MAKGIVKLIDKIVRLRLIGRIEHGDGDKVCQQIAALTPATPAVLIDLQDLELPDKSAVSEMERVLSRLSYRKMALCGNRPSVMAAVSLLLKSATNGVNVKLFRDEELARAWLLA